MVRRLSTVIAAIFLLLQLSGCLAAFPNESVPTTDTIATTQPTISPTVPVPQYIEVWREGEVSRIPVQTVTGKAGPYTIAMDPEFFTFLPQEGSDLFSYEAWGSDQPVYYRITPYSGAYDPAAFITQGVPAGYQLTGAQAITLAGFPATAVSMTGLGENSSYVLHKYLIDCGDVRYCMEARFCFEMYEGLFPIIYACFETFTPMK